MSDLVVQCCVDALACIQEFYKKIPPVKQNINNGKQCPLDV